MIQAPVRLMKSSASEPLNIGNKRCFTITTHSFLLYRHKKTKFFENFLRVFGRILDISKKNFRAFFGKKGKISERILGHVSGIM